jgi:hypothetical protein
MTIAKVVLHSEDYGANVLEVHFTEPAHRTLIDRNDIKTNDAADLLELAIEVHTLRAQLQSARQGEAVNDALEKAAIIARDAETMWGDDFDKKYGIGTTAEELIRALINTSPPSQEATREPVALRYRFANNPHKWHYSGMHDTIFADYDEMR